MNENKNNQTHHDKSQDLFNDNNVSFQSQTDKDMTMPKKVVKGGALFCR